MICKICSLANLFVNPFAPPLEEEQGENEPQFKLFAVSSVCDSGDGRGEPPALLTCSLPLVGALLVRLLLADLWVPEAGSCL